MPKIFISYRRGDSLDATGRIDDRLAAHFGREEVFRDLDTLLPGREFPQSIQDALKSCQVLLAIIGEDWVNARFEDGTRRLDDEHDYVRLEIEAALDQGTLVIPILVRLGRLPKAAELPELLKPLLKRTATEVRSDRHFHSHVDRLIRDIERHLGPSAPKPNSESSRPSEIRVVPKGLRSFNSEDADFFLDLLPGPKDRNGLPESIRFWKTRIEETDPTATFQVGLIYGPSGCGKSSLIKAGLLPQLGGHIKPVFVEASDDNTEFRLLSKLRHQFPGLASSGDLESTIRQLRERELLGPHDKVLIVIDQFEQWLQSHTNVIDTELVRSMRLCDGDRIQCIVLVRDDFYLAASRFFDALDVDLSSNHNQALLDLFDTRHAHEVLTAFGRAYGCLPRDSASLTAEQQRFVKQAVSELSGEDRIVCVRLALFADMVKGKPWIPATLKQLGGVAGVGVKFLEENLESREGNPVLRQHSGATRQVLQALMLEPRVEIRRHSASYQQLLEQSGYASRQSDFDDMLRSLDAELRLITPTDTANGLEQEHEDSPQSSNADRHYQLTHDYLVPSLREWLTRKQKETRRGRAELRLADRATLWNAKPENRRLPSWWEYLSVVGLTTRKNWTEAQRKMMRKAGRFHGARAAMGLAVVALVAFGGVRLRQGILEGQRQAQQEADSKERSARAEELVNSLQNADIGKVREIVDQLELFQDLPGPLLRKQLAEAADGSSQKRNLSLGLLATDPNQVKYLYQQLLQAEAEEFPVIRDFLVDHKDQLVQQLWEVLDNPQGDTADEQLHAAAALATYDPANSKWEAVHKRVAAELVAVPVSFLDDWKEAFRPIAKDLVEPLADIYRDEEADALARSLATSLLADYARQDGQQLASLVSTANEKQFAVFYPILSKLDSVAVKELQSIVQRKTEPTWNDEALDAAWQPIDPSIKQAIESAQGILDERFALCQTMPLKQCAEVAASLRQSGYRPVRFRPYAIDDNVQVAAVWTRDSRTWQFDHDLTAEQIQAKDQVRRQEGLIPIDVSGYLGRDEEGQPANRYASIWGESGEEDQDREVRMYAGVPVTSEQAEHADPWSEAGFNRLTLHEFVGQDGVEYRSSVWSKQKDQEQSSSKLFAGIESHFTGEVYPGLLLTDLNISRTAKPQDPKEQYAAQLKTLEPLLADRADDANLRKSIATVRFQMKQDEQALADLNWLIEKLPDDSQLYQYRAIIHARAKRADEAKQDLAKFTELSKDASQNAYLDAIVSAHLGEDAEGMQRLEAAISQAASDMNVLYNGACAYSLASEVFAAEEVAKSKVYADRAVALLREAFTAGYDNYEQIQQDADLAPLREHSGFIEFMGVGKLDRRCAAVWNVSTEFESTELHGLAPDEQRQRCRELMAADYRPAVMSVSTVKDSSSLVTTSVWHRPLVPDADKESLAKQQANAAVALLRMDQGDAVWPLLKHSPDPRTRSYLIHLLNPLGATSGAIIERLDVEPDVSIRRALILTLGEFDDQQLPPAEQEQLTVKLLETYATDPDAGIHAAAEWVLRRWGQDAQLKEKDRELATGTLEGSRQWYVNKQGQTLVVIPGPVEFVMGSPVGEATREGGPEGQLEIQHRKRINRTFAMMTHEVTVDQFREFQNDYSYSKTYSRAGDDPMTQVTWYAAAEYCNWLSKQEGIPKDQWCYLSHRLSDGTEEFAEGMKPASDYLERSGYRLPTESEWEYASRSGALTSRYFGETEELLGQYAWATKNSLNRWTLPVGSLKPNDLGLFDMQGNVREWCHEVVKYYRVSMTGGLSEDLPDLSEVRDNQLRVLRGGSFGYLPQFVRSAFRSWNRPYDHFSGLGMRAARTYP